MKIVTDNGIDIAPELLAGLDVEVVPLTITLDNKHYKGEVDIKSDAFYKLVRASSDFPVTSQPSPADFEAAYLRIGKDDPDIVSIHISSVLSGTYNAARLGAEMAAKQGINVTVFDTRGASGSQAWVVEAAAHAAKAGNSLEDVLAIAEKVARNTRILFSPDTLKYLVHGGRVSNLKGFAASVLNIKPLLQVSYEKGTMDNLGSVRTMKKALGKHIDQIEEEYSKDTALRIQIEHSDNPDDAAIVKEMLAERLNCNFLPTTSLTPLIGAHTGPGAVAIIYAPMSVFEGVL